MRRWTGAIELERVWPETAHDEVPIAIRRAVQVALVVRPHPVAPDDDSVRVRMVVEIHVLRLIEGRTDRVAPRSGVRRVPVGDRGTGGDVEALSHRGKPGIVQHLPLRGFLGIDFSLPAGYGDAAVGDRTGCVLRLSIRCRQRQREGCCRTDETMVLHESTSR